jgi:hypothetical protein
VSGQAREASWRRRRQNLIKSADWIRQSEAVCIYWLENKKVNILKPQR